LERLLLQQLPTNLGGSKPVAVVIAYQKRGSEERLVPDPRHFIPRFLGNRRHSRAVLPLFYSSLSQTAQSREELSTALRFIHPAQINATTIAGN
jgi:hypothetical protein